MPFFENSSNFKITGGTFNVISGDLNQYETNYSTFTAHSFNNNPNGAPNHPYYHPYAPPPPPPRGRPTPRHPQYQHQGRGAFGYAEYYDDMPPSEDQYGGHEDRGAGSRFEASMRSPDHYVEISEAEFIAARQRDVTTHYHPSAGEGRGSTQDSQGSMSGILANPIIEENLGESASENDMVEEESTPLPDTSDTAVPAAADLPQSAQKPLTTVERMRMAMAEMDITGMDQTQAVDAPSDLPSSISEGKQKSAQSFSRIFQRKPTRQSTS
ncbi:hypothetical protein FB451DRAFT_1209008 [Mycena latifolia]|nr:hypothetical protein FB451DRAFT_1209008 [Mycena latifolia]